MGKCAFVFLDKQRCHVVIFRGVDDAMKDTTISLKIERGLKAKLLVLARNENRTLSNFIEKMLKDEVARREGKPAHAKSE